MLEVPWELNWRFSKVSTRLFGDYAQNLNGSQRAEAAFNASRKAFQPINTAGIATISSPQTDDIHAYQAGIAVGTRDCLGLMDGSICRKHAWEFRTYWQRVEQYALDVNLIDSDFFEGRANLQGVVAALSYGFTDNILGTVRYGYATRINNKLGTGGSNQDIPQMNPIARYNILQVDLAFEF